MFRSAHGVVQLGTDSAFQQLLALTQVKLCVPLDGYAYALLDRLVRCLAGVRRVTVGSQRRTALRPDYGAIEVAGLALLLALSFPLGLDGQQIIGERNGYPFLSTLEAWPRS